MDSTEQHEADVRNIEKYAFRKDNRPWGTAYITEVINRSEKPQLIDEYHFFNNDLSKAVLRVPEQSIEAYKTAKERISKKQN